MNPFRQLLLFASLLPLTPLFAADAATPSDWELPEAAYRLQARSGDPNQPTAIDLRELLLPVRPTNGVQVRANGETIASDLRPSGLLLIPPAPKSDGRYQIYFGFDATVPAISWPENTPKPAEERIALRLWQGANQICTPEEFLVKRHAEIERQSAWALRYIPRRSYRLMLAHITGGALLLREENPRQAIQRQRNRKLQLLHPKRDVRQAAVIAALLPEFWPTQPGEATRTPRLLAEHFNYANRENRKIAGRYEQAEKDKALGAEEDMLRRTRNPRGNVRQAAEVQLFLRPPETTEFYTALFTGLLQVPESGEYEFELESNSLTRVELDGEVRFRHAGNGISPTERQRVTLTLTAGSHPFALHYRLNRGSGQLAMRWRKSGAGEFRVMDVGDFLPAQPLQALELNRREGGRYPLVSRHGHYLLFLDKLTQLEVNRFRTLSPEPLLARRDEVETPAAELDWQILPLRGEPALEFRDPSGKLLPLPVLPAEPTVYQVPIPADLSLKFWLPDFLYDTETLTGAVELFSKLPFAVKAKLDRDGQADLIALAAKPDERFSRFGQDVVEKRSFPLNGALLRPGMTTTFALSLPGLEFDRKTIRLLSPSGREPIRWEPGEGFLDQDGNRVVFLLHRPTLAELRNWELPRKLRDELRPSSRVLLIAEEYGFGESALSRRFAEALKEQKRELIFLPLIGEENRWYESLPLLRQTAGLADADQAILMVPCRAHSGNLEPWIRDRLLASYLELLQSNRQLRHITLAMPPDPDLPESEQKELRDALMRLAREYDVEFLDTNLSLSAGDSTWSKPVKAGESSHHPETWNAELLQLFLQESD